MSSFWHPYSVNKTKLKNQQAIMYSNVKMGEYELATNIPGQLHSNQTCSVSSKMRTLPKTSKNLASYTSPLLRIKNHQKKISLAPSKRLILQENPTPKCLSSLSLHIPSSEIFFLSQLAPQDTSLLSLLLTNLKKSLKKP